jgi:hypothetical protein
MQHWAEESGGYATGKQIAKKILEEFGKVIRPSTVSHHRHKKGI